MIVLDSLLELKIQVTDLLISISHVFEKMWRLTDSESMQSTELFKFG